MAIITDYCYTPYCSFLSRRRERISHVNGKSLCFVRFLILSVRHCPILLWCIAVNYIATIHSYAHTHTHTGWKKSLGFHPFIASLLYLISSVNRTDIDKIHNYPPQTNVINIDRWSTHLFRFVVCSTRTIETAVGKIKSKQKSSSETTWACAR